MKSDFLIAIAQLSAEKNLPREVVYRAVEAALLSALKKDTQAANQNLAVRIQGATGDVKVFLLKNVVDEVTDPEKEITVAEAKAFASDPAVGQTVEIETTPRWAGRIAAQTAKQVVLQRLREAEREVVYEEFSEREGEVVSGLIQRVEPKQVVIALGKSEAILPASEQVKTERYRVGQRTKVYIMEVSRSARGPQVIVSRAHRNLLRRLLELEVPEVASGVVEVKAIAREAGSRSKVAVTARQEGVDPVGSCVGLRGIRIQNIVNELAGEKIDVIHWHQDPKSFIGAALSPAQVLDVQANEGEKNATVVVPDRQLSLAIGKEGQNARLAAKLTGWRIDIKSSSIAEAERAARPPEAAAPVVEAIPVEAAPVTAAAEMAVAEAPLAAEAPVVAIPGLAAEMPSAPLTIETPEVVEEAAVEAVVAEPVAVGVVEASKPKEPAQIRFAEDILPRATKGAKERGRREDRDEAARTKKGKRSRGREVNLVAEEVEE